MDALAMRAIPQRPLPASGRRFIINKSVQAMELLQKPLQPRKTHAFSFMKAMFNLSCSYEAYQDIKRGQNTLTVTKPPRLQAAKNLSELEKSARELMRNMVISITGFFGKNLENFNYSVSTIGVSSAFFGMGGGIISSGVAAVAGTGISDFFWGIVGIGAGVSAFFPALFLSQLRAASNFLSRMREEFTSEKNQANSPLL